MKRLRSPLSLLALAALVAVGGEARADWLVTKDGAQLETKGPWKVDGRRIVFTLPNGMLSALRADDVDLDQSAVATARAVEAARAVTEPKEEPRKRAPVLVLTEKDIPPMSGADAAEGEETAEGAPANPAATPEQVLEVLSWEKTPSDSGDSVEIFGSLKNGTTNNITSPTLMVMIYGPDGGLIATNEATVNAGMIPAGRTANFRVAFPGVPDFAAVKFDAQGRGFRTTSPVEEGAEEPEPPIDEEPDQEPPPNA